MKQRPHLYRMFWISILCIGGLVLFLYGCVTAPSSLAQNPTIINTVMDTTKTVAIASVSSEIVTSVSDEAVFTEPAQVSDTGTVITIDQNITATPVVWIDTSTVNPEAATLPIYPTFTVTSTPTITLTPTKGPSPRNTRTPTATSTVTPTSNPPNAVLNINQPGLASKIKSPYEIEAAITRGEDLMVYLSLIGENQKVFYSEVLDYRLSEYNRLLITPTLNFSISTVAENARLILQTYDLQGRILALSSVDLILLSIGNNEINPAQHAYSPFLIDSPNEGDQIQTTRLIVSGRAAALNKNPVIIELLDENGEILAKREIIQDPALAGETYTPFVIELDFSVDRQIQARLSVRQESDNRISGTVALSSIAITLLP